MNVLQKLQKKKKKLDLGMLTAKGIDVPEKWALKKKLVYLLLIKLKTIKHSKQVKQSKEKKCNNKMISSKETTGICLFVTFPRR